MIDVENALRALGVEIVSMSGDEIRGVCPMHYQRTSKRGSIGDWYVNTDSGMHHCWSCDYGGSLMGLVYDVTGLKPWDARKWLVDQGVASLIADDLVPRKFKEARKLAEAREKAPKVTESHILMYDPVPEDQLAKRDLDADAADRYEIKWDYDHEAWIIPIRDPWGDLLGYQFKSKGYVRNRPEGMRKDATLFGLHVVPDDEDTLIVVESPLDVVRLATAGFNNGVATMGASISDEQISLLAAHARNLVLAMDNDLAGKSANRKIRAALENRVRISIFDYSSTDGAGINGWAKDPGDMNDKQIERAMRNAKSPLRKKLEGIF